MLKEDENVLLIDDKGIKFIGTIDLIDNNKYYININDTILIFNLINGYLEKDNNLYYCKEYFIENNFIKINFFLEDLKKSNYLSKKLIYKLLEFNNCECNDCLNFKIINLCKFLNNLLIEMIILKIQELDIYIQNLDNQLKNNFIKKILNLKTTYDNLIHLDNVCCICLDEINDTNKFIINCTVCNHIFCYEDCFKKYIQNDDRCPYCRINLKEWIKIE